MMPCSTFMEDGSTLEDVTLVKRNVHQNEKKTFVNEENSEQRKMELEKSEDDWFPTNPFLTCHQREPTACYKACIKSIFQNNTEACNVWTHLIATLVMLYSWFEFLELPSSSFVHENQEKLVTSMMYLSAVICFAFSTTFHTFYCHSESVFNFTLRLDLIGVLIAILGVCTPWIYYTFYYDTTTQMIYAAVLIVSAPLVLYVATHPDSLHDSCGELLVTAVGLTVLHDCSCVMVFIPAITVFGYLQLSIQNGFKETWDVGHKYYVYYILWDLIGIIVLGARVPERIFAGRLDGWIHSHPIFHTCTAIAAYNGIWFTDTLRKSLLHGTMAQRQFN